MCHSRNMLVTMQSQSKAMRLQTFYDCTAIQRGTDTSVWIILIKASPMIAGRTRSEHFHPALTTASSDSIITVVTSCSDASDCTRHRASFSENDKVASKNNG